MIKAGKITIEEDVLESGIWFKKDDGEGFHLEYEHEKMKEFIKLIREFYEETM